MTDENSITNYFSNMNYKNSSGFYTYSFALNPENHQPSGSLNFSKLDKAELRLRIRRDKMVGLINQINNVSCITPD